MLRGQLQAGRTNSRVAHSSLSLHKFDELNEIRNRIHAEQRQLVSDPVSVGENLVFVDALEQKSGQVKRVRIPPTIVQMARIKRRAA